MAKSMSMMVAACLILTLGGETKAGPVFDLDLSGLSTAGGIGTYYGSVLGTITFTDSTLRTVESWDFTYVPANNAPISMYEWTTFDSIFNGNSYGGYFNFVPINSNDPTITLSTQTGTINNIENDFFYASDGNFISEGGATVYVAGTLSPQVLSVPEPLSLSMTAAALGLISLIAYQRSQPSQSAR